MRKIPEIMPPLQVRSYHFMGCFLHLLMFEYGVINHISNRLVSCQI